MTSWDKFMSLFDPLKVDEISDGWAVDTEDLDDEATVPDDAYEDGFYDGSMEGYMGGMADALWLVEAMLGAALKRSESKKASKELRSIYKDVVAALAALEGS